MYFYSNTGVITICNIDDIADYIIRNNKKKIEEMAFEIEVLGVKGNDLPVHSYVHLDQTYDKVDKISGIYGVSSEFKRHRVKLKKVKNLKSQIIKDILRLNKTVDKVSAHSEDLDDYTLIASEVGEIVEDLCMRLLEDFKNPTHLVIFEKKEKTHIAVCDIDSFNLILKNVNGKLFFGVRLDTGNLDSIQLIKK
jgi:hypothetical protein